MKTATWKQKLRVLEPCPEAYKWACQYSTLEEAWRACENGYWMHWLVCRCGLGTHEMIEAITRADDVLFYADVMFDFMPDPPELL